MSGMSNFLENKFIDWFFRAQAIGITGASAAAGTGPATLYVGLFTVAPSDTGGGTEVTGNNYARASVTSSMEASGWAGTQSAGSTTASSGAGATTSNNGTITFPTPSGLWGTVVAFGIFDEASEGNLLWFGDITPNKTINSGDAITFPAGSLTVTVDNG